tara:strand:- start:498 stop:1160 length:663 start_codon:yes stop_codon:yes gene_type:complete
VNTNFPCETSSIRSTYEYASARGCFYIDGNGDTWKKKTETWIDAGNPDETLTFELEGVAGPNQSTTIPACAAAIETGSADPAQYTLDDTTYSLSFLDTDTDTTLSPDTPATGNLADEAGSVFTISYAVTYDGSGNMITAQRGEVMLAINGSSNTYGQTLTYQVTETWVHTTGPDTSTVHAAVEFSIEAGIDDQIIGSFLAPTFQSGTTGGTTTITITQCA